MIQKEGLRFWQDLVGRVFLFSAILVYLVLVSLFGAFAQVSFFDTYVYGDIVTFTVCGDDARMNPPAVSVTCLDSQLASAQWNMSCQVFAFDSYDLTCANPYVAVNSQLYEIELNSGILPIIEFIDSPTNASNPRDIALKIYAHDVLNNTAQRQEYMNTLRDLRNEAHKCWPQSGCDLPLTIDILNILSLSGLDVTNRIYQDALLFISSRQVRGTNNDMLISIDSINGATCQIRRGETVSNTILFNRDREHITFVYDTTSPLNVTCDYSFSVELIDWEGNRITQGNSRFVDDSVEDGPDNSYYTFVYNARRGCIPYVENRWDHCDLASTAKFLTIRGLDAGVVTDGLAYLASAKQQRRIGSVYGNDQDIVTNIYGYSVTGDADVYQWLLFNQYNDGRFSTDSTITIEAYRLLDTTNEWTEDAVKWISANRQYGGWGDTYGDLLTYDLFEPNITPIRSNPILLQTDETRLRFSINESKSINFTHSQIILQEIPDTPEYLLMLNTTQDGLYSGKMLVNDRLSIPLVFTRTPRITVSKSDLYYVTDARGIIEVPVTLSTSIEYCEFTFDDYLRPATFSANRPILELSYTFSETGEYTILGTYECFGSFYPISGVVSFYIMRELTPPIDVSLLGRGTERSPYELRIQNKILRDIDVALSWDGATPTHLLPASVSLEPHQAVRIPIVQTNPTNLPEEITKIIAISTLGYQTTQDVVLTIAEQPVLTEQPELVYENPVADFLIYVIMGVAGIMILIVLVAFAKVALQNRSKRLAKIRAQKQKLREGAQKQILASQLQNSIAQTQSASPDKSPADQSLDKPADSTVDTDSVKSADESSQVVQTPTQKHAGRAVEVFIGIKRTLGKTDAQIISELVDSGYEKGEIQRVLDDLNTVRAKPAPVEGSSDSTANADVVKPADSKEKK